MDLGAFKRELLIHYIRLAESPAFKAHAWHQVNELAQKYPREFSDLPELLTAEMKKRKEPCSKTPMSCSGTDGASGAPASNTGSLPKPC